MLRKRKNGDRIYFRISGSRMLCFSVLKLLNGSRKAFSNRENSIQFRDDEQFFDLIRNAADGRVAAILSRLRKNVDEHI